jgi:tRNA dimethylallyltransferase
MARDHQRRRCVIVAGPTAGGKSALAADIAEAAGGTVINADSMQVYDGLAVVTAQPSAADRARVPHVLYGTVPPDARYSAGRWAEAATAAAEGAWAAGRLPVFCGGTGFYLETLTRGLSPIPAVPDAVRAAVAERRTAQDPARFHGALAAVDPAMAARLDPADGQRIARALEVFEATGKTLSDWQADAPPQPMLDAETLTLVAAPDRGTLYAAIDARFETMVQAGAADEVRALLDRRLDPALPAMKALGVPELAAFVRGEIPLDEAVARAQRKSRNYAKRQMTWLRGRLAHDPPSVFWVGTKYSESVKENFFSIVRGFGLTV